MVFYNCRIYNGTESFVGRIGVDVNREYDNLLQAYGLKERFENKVDINALVSELLGAQIFSEDPKPDLGQDTNNQINYNSQDNNTAAQKQEPTYQAQPMVIEQQNEPLPEQIKQTESQQSVTLAQPSVPINQNADTTLPQEQISQTAAIPLPPPQTSDNNTMQQPVEGQHNQASEGAYGDSQGAPVHQKEEP